MICCADCMTSIMLNPAQTFTSPSTLIGVHNLVLPSSAPSVWWALPDQSHISSDGTVLGLKASGPWRLWTAQLALPWHV